MNGAQDGLLNVDARGGGTALVYDLLLPLNPTAPVGVGSARMMDGHAA